MHLQTLFTQEEYLQLQSQPTRTLAELQEDQSLSHDIKDDKEFIYLFLENKKQGSKDTARSYAYELVQFLKFVGFPDVPLKKVSFKMCNAYRKYLTEGKDEYDKPLNYAVSTITRKLNIVSSLYRFGMKIDYLEKNPIAAVVKPKVQVTTQDRYLTVNEVKKLLEELKKHPRNYLLAIILITTGLRASEIINVQWKHFYEDQKGNIGLKVIGKRNKERTVKIRRDIWSFIMNYRLSQNKTVAFDPADESYLFLKEDGNRLSTTRYLRMLFKDTAKNAGINKSISTHWLRHTSASLAINGGADIKVCMESYGWNHMQTAQRYIHDINKLEKTAVDFIDIEV